MTTATLPVGGPATATRTGSAGQVRFGRICRSEWTKLRSVRSTWWSLGAGVVFTLGLGAAAAMDSAGDPAAHPSATQIAAGSQFGVLFSQLAILVLAALAVTGEYGTGMIRSSLTVVPRRVPVLAAKAVVLAAVVFPVTLATTAASFVLTNAIFASQGRAGAGLGDQGVPAILLGVPIYLTVAAVFALAVGTLIRNTAAAISVVTAVFFVIPMVSAGISALHGIAPYLPSNAGGAMSHQNFAEVSMAGGTGMTLFVGYTLAIVVAAVVRLRRTDV